MDARPGPDWARPTGGKIKGFAVVNLLALAKERYGPQTLFDYAQTVPAEFRTQVEKQMVLASAWVPMELYYSAIGFLVRRHHQGDPMAARQLGHDLTSKDVNSFFRMFLSAVLLIIVAKARGIPLWLHGIPAMWVRALAGSFGMIGNFYALTVMPVSDATAIYHTMPVWVALIRWVVYKERLAAAQWLCVAGAIAGVIAVGGDDPGASAFDTYDGNLTSKIVVTG